MNTSHPGSPPPDPPPPLEEVEGLLVSCVRALGEAWRAIRHDRFTAVKPEEVHGGEDAASPED